MRYFVVIWLVALLTALLPSPAAFAVTTGNGALVYSPPAGSSFNPEGGRAAGTTYAKVVALRYGGAPSGTLLSTYDKLVLENGVQVYPIHRSTNGGTTWSRVTAVDPSRNFSGLVRTAQPFLYELPQQVGDLPAGTVLLSGMIMPENRSSSRLVVYASRDRGATWTLRSTVDTGGPATYDPSPTSTTTTVWEPSLIVDGTGNLVCYYSDERQKSAGVLQAVSYRRSTDGGRTWGSLVNVSAPTNRSDRPGMITVTKLPDGRYMASYEVVNRPSRSLNTAPVYVKFSRDGLDWSPQSSIGTPVRLSDGRGIGSSPFITWSPNGGPNGTVIIASKWALTADGRIDGGQSFFVNRNLGSGNWERLPYAVTFDGPDAEGGTFSGFAQGLAVSADGRTLYQATNVENRSTTYNDIRVGTLPLAALGYEAEQAARTNTTLVGDPDASSSTKVGNINFSDSSVRFTVQAPSAGSYTVDVRYANGTGAASSHSLRVNGASPVSVAYPPTVNWGRYGWAQVTVPLRSGSNTLEFRYSGTFAELDLIRVHGGGIR